MYDTQNNLRTLMWIRRRLTYVRTLSYENFRGVRTTVMMNRPSDDPTNSVKHWRTTVGQSTIKSEDTEVLGRLRARPNEIKALSSRPTWKNCSLWHTKDKNTFSLIFPIFSVDFQIPWPSRFSRFTATVGFWVKRSKIKVTESKRRSSGRCEFVLYWVPASTCSAGCEQKRLETKHSVI